MGFPLDYLLQLLQSITYHILPLHLHGIGMGGKCAFPVVLFKACHQSQSQSQSHSKNTDNTKPDHLSMDSPLTLESLHLEGTLNKSYPGNILPLHQSRPLVLPTIVSETRKNPAAVKHSLVESHDADGENDVQRSMARRKKNEPPMDINKKCPHCNKVFKRPCDFTKHEKTHIRPWKCPVEDCKYFLNGWPTEKERDRHVNDRHSVNPPEYHCKFEPCTYTSKRESNLKQHMEKAHGWTYIRSKKNGKRGQTPSDASPNQTTPPTPAMPLTPAMSTPISSLSTELPSPASGQMASPYVPNMSHEPVIYQGSYMDNYSNMSGGPAFNFADPPMMSMSGFDYSDFQLFPNTDLDTIGLDPVPQPTAEDFQTFTQVLETTNPADLIAQPPSADMSLDQLGQDQLNPYCFDNEFYTYQTNGVVDFQQNNGMADFQPNMSDFQSHNGMQEF